MDGSPVHNGVTGYLNGIFQGRWMGRFGGVRWPARSPDLNPLDFFYWPHLKTTLYSQPRCNNIPELQNRVLQISNEIPARMITSSIEAFYHRLGYCNMAEGVHFEQYLRARRPREDIVLEYDDFQDVIRFGVLN